MLRDQKEMEALAMVHGRVFGVHGSCDTLGVDFTGHVRLRWHEMVYSKFGHPRTSSPCMVLRLRGELRVGQPTYPELVDL
jgi:hypothetical protein